MKRTGRVMVAIFFWLPCSMCRSSSAFAMERLAGGRCSRPRMRRRLKAFSVNEAAHSVVTPRAFSGQVDGQATAQTATEQHRTRRVDVCAVAQPLEDCFVVQVQAGLGGNALTLKRKKEQSTGP